MLMERIIGAFTFRKEVYAEVERDVEFKRVTWVPGFGLAGNELTPISATDRRGEKDCHAEKKRRCKYEAEGTQLLLVDRHRDHSPKGTSVQGKS